MAMFYLILFDVKLLIYHHVFFTFISDLTSLNTHIWWCLSWINKLSWERTKENFSIGQPGTQTQTCFISLIHKRACTVYSHKHIAKKNFSYYSKYLYFIPNNVYLWWNKKERYDFHGQIVTYNLLFFSANSFDGIMWATSEKFW